MRKQQFVQRKNLHAQRGIGMVDALMWLVIFAVILGAIIQIRNLVWPKAQGWLEGSSVTSSMQQINSMFTGAPNFAGLTTASVATTTFFESKYLAGGGTIGNRFGGSVTLAVGTINTPNDTMIYTETGVPSRACLMLANQMNDDADRITVGGTVVKALNGTITPTTLSTECNSSPTVSVVFEKILQH
ncbi:hypothetical protein LPN04_31425 [Rugamonas sp. A1-17]|nr:hypothetical protein [Rugamonas sp. A1-17]